MDTGRDPLLVDDMLDRVVSVTTYNMTLIQVPQVAVPLLRRLLG